MDNEKNEKTYDLPTRQHDGVPVARKEGYLAVDLEDESLMRQTAICPKCSKTAIKQRRATNSWHCLVCDVTYTTDEMIDVREED